MSRDLFGHSDQVLQAKLIRYIPGFITNSLPNPGHQALHYRKAIYQELMAETEWSQPDLVLFGKKTPTPRLVGFMADNGVSYRYSGHRHQAQAWSPELAKLRINIERYLGTPFNSALLNYYRDGRDYMGWHTDSEASLGTNPCVASISLGAARDFKIRHKTTNETYAITLATGSLLVMEPGFQAQWQHALPKRLKIDQPRINITFRNILD